MTKRKRKIIEKEEIIEGYTLNEEGYYVTDEIFRGKFFLKECEQCGNYLQYVYAEKYLFFKEAGILMIMGIKIYGLECDTCVCGFIYKDE